MTSEDLIEDLRRNGVKLIKNDGSLTVIPPDFLKRATEREGISLQAVMK